MTELPESKGAYILIASVAQTKRLTIGRLGEFIIIPGFYAYLGSACGHGGIRARVGHHLEPIAQPHWHIDYLLGFATPIEVWCAISDRKLEQDWAKMLQDSPKFRTPIPQLRLIGLPPDQDNAPVLLKASFFVPVVRGEDPGGLRAEHPSSTVHSSGKRQHVVPAIPSRNSPTDC